MCGIAGIVLEEHDPRLAPWLATMTQRLFHRGPDSGGVVLFGSNGSPTIVKTLGGPEDRGDWGYLVSRIGLGARRLAVRDRSSAGAQPMAAPDRHVWLVFNGEIYNHAALRDELTARGTTFVGHSDTEVVLAAYRAWGTDAFARLEGMWAIALVDWAAGRVVLSRDRLGIKPLYVTQFDAGLAFASEIKSLLVLPGAARGVNEAALRDFLASGQVDHTDATFFDGVYAFPPGCWMEFDQRRRGALEYAGVAGRYWQPESGTANILLDKTGRAKILLGQSGRAKILFGQSGRAKILFAPDASRDLHGKPSADLPRDARANSAQPLAGQKGSLPYPSNSQHEIMSRLDSAVRSHLVSDVAVGSCLSGGIDSSAIVALAARAIRSDASACPNWSQHVFTAVLPGSPLDEAAHAARLVDHVGGLNAHTVIPTADDLLADLDKLVWHQEQPFGSPSIYMQWAVMRAAWQAGVTVLLDGQGGDELFCGYEGYWPPLIAHLLRHGHVARAVRQYNAVPPAAFARRDLALRTAAHLLPTPWRHSLRARRAARGHDWLAGELFDVDEPASIYTACRVRPPAPLAALETGSGFSRHAWRILTSESLPSLLRFEDRNSMAFSIEARVPLLDRAVVETAMVLDPSAKLQDGLTKAALRTALRGVVPEDILNRRDKIGFAAPTTDWMRGPLAAWHMDLTASKSFTERGCFEPRGIAELQSRLSSGDTTAALCLWRANLVEAWARQFLDDASRS